MKKLKKRIPEVTLCIFWYKKHSGIFKYLSENIIREFALKNNLIDVKVCAVSEAWSGLKLVAPLAKR